MTTDENKRLRRLEAKAARDVISDDERAAAALAVARHAAPLRELCAGRATAVSSYLAIGSELDPEPLVQRLRALGVTIALPVMVAKSAPLEFRAWAAGDPLVAREWGIREPGPECPVVSPGIVLVPLLEVDGSGNRLGYGGGFYDRTLNRLRSEAGCVAVGLGYSTQRVDAVPHAAYDEPLDYLLTPDGLTALQ